MLDVQSGGDSLVVNIAKGSNSTFVLQQLSLGIHRLDCLIG